MGQLVAGQRLSRCDGALGIYVGVVWTGASSAFAPSGLCAEQHKEASRERVDTPELQAGRSGSLWQSEGNTGFHIKTQTFKLQNSSVTAF